LEETTVFFTAGLHVTSGNPLSTGPA